MNDQNSALRRTRMFGYKRVAFLLLFASCALSATAQKGEDVSIFTDPGRRFSVEFPTGWEWKIISPAGEPLALFLHPKSEAAVVVEHLRLKLRLEAEEITDVFLNIESDYIKEHQPKATNVVARFSTRNGRKIVIVDYTRPADDERAPERVRVRQYSLPEGQDLFRLTCMAAQSRFTRYESTFASIAESFTTAEALGRAK
jgi:photosystem II reaction center protein PsbP